MTKIADAIAHRYVGRFLLSLFAITLAATVAGNIIALL